MKKILRTILVISIAATTLFSFSNLLPYFKAAEK